MKVAIYVDEDVYGDLARVLREHGVDAQSVGEAGRYGLDDSAQLAYAAATGRAVLTFNREHYERLAVEYFLNGWEHAGIIVSPQYTFGELLRRVLRLVESMSAEELRGEIRYLQSFEDYSWAE
jgi:hypothetical protein